MQKTKKDIAKQIYIILNKLSSEIDLTEDNIFSMLEYPPDSAMGDLAFPCFRLSKQLRKPPVAIAEAIKAGFVCDSVIECVSAGGYINFKLNNKNFIAEFLANILSAKEKYGSSGIGVGKKIVIDYSSPNIAKPFHIGHLRSTVIGNAIKNIHRFTGYDCTAINYLGDWGTQFGKVITAYKLWCNDMDEIEEKGVYKLMELYVKFTTESENDKSLNDEARKWFALLEQGNVEALDLWRKFRDISLEEYKRSYALIGIEFDSYDGESFFNDKMDVVVEELKEKNLLKLDQGAQIVDLSEYDMPPCLILKSDGATLYPTRDIASALYRKKTYDFDKNIYVTDMRQILHFAQWKKVTELMGYDFAEDCEHVTFGLMSFGGESLGTRKGNILLLDTLFNMAIEKVENIIEEKSPHLSDEQKKDIATKVGVGAIIFNDLSNGRMKDVNFDWEETLNFDGNSGPYVQYTYARICGVLNKSEQEIFAVPNNPNNPNEEIILNSLERELIKTMALFPEKVLVALKEYEPSVISRYLLDLCAAYNRFYHECSILKAENENIKMMRLAICDAAKYVIGNGLSLLGLAKTTVV